MIVPLALEPGAVIGVFSPSEPLFPSRVDRVRKNAAQLEEMGNPVIYGSNAFKVRYHSAGTPEERSADVLELVSDNRVGMLLGSWGGKTCNELLSLVDFDAIARSRKPVAGFSDVAVLLNAVSAASGLITFHGPNVLGKLEESNHSDLTAVRPGSSLMNAGSPLFGDTSSGVTIVGGQATGTLYGGNLSTFTLGLAGSPFMATMDDVVFFWESADERPQLIVQHLTALKNCGFLARVSAMVIGETRYEDEGYEYQDVHDAVLDVMRPFDVPIVRFPTFGHSDLENPVIPIGAHCELDASALSARLLSPALATR